MSQSTYNWWPTDPNQGSGVSQQLPAGVAAAQSLSSSPLAQSPGTMQSSTSASSPVEMQGRAEPRVVVPAIDVYETADEILVLADTPGFDQDDIELQADEQSLLLTATREQEAEEGRTPLLQERPTHLERVVQVPPGADIEGAKATHDDGVCTVRIPKNESRRRRTIAFQ